MSGYFSELISGAESLLSGLGVTLKMLFTRPVTAQYPREKVPLSPHARGRVALIRKNDAFVCIACGMCKRTCPSGCIDIISEKKEDRKGKHLTGFMYDISKCSLCNLCIEVCPVGAICFIPERGRTGTGRENFKLDLITLEGPRL